MSWQPIRTAPQDGTDVLVFGLDAGKYPMFAAAHFEDWYEPEWITCDASKVEFSPSHWMPLPAPPSDPHAPSSPSGP